jgi:hypothetical protein
LSVCSTMWRSQAPEVSDFRIAKSEPHVKI